MSFAWQPHVLREYALIADGERGALIGPDGAMVWLCFPRWDSAAVFASLVGGGGGYAVRPVEASVWGGHYDDGTLIWRNRWTTTSGRVECRDALTVPGRPDQAVIVRRVSALQSPAVIRVRLALRTDFGSTGVRDLRLDSDGCWRGRLGAGSFCWAGAPEAVVVRDGRHHDLEAEVRLPAGETRDLVLAIAESAGVAAPPTDAAWAAVEESWRRRLPPRAQLGHAARDVRHAHAVLNGLTSSSGAMVAAATLGLPERAAAGRNYDYRYAWIRDQCFAGQAVADGPDLTLLDASTRFVTGRLLEHGPSLAPAYRVDGSPVPDQSRLNLPGYPGGADVVGNWVTSQFQLDAFGDAVLLLSAAERADRLDSDGWTALRTAVAAIEARHGEPDAGIWELDPQLWTQSRLQCAAGLKAASRLPRAGGQASGWAALADRIVADAAARGLHPSGRWQRSPDDPRVDAALLLPAVRGLLPPSDPRSAATLAAVLDDLVQDGYCYRFRHGEQPLAVAEGAFLLCGFLVALSLLDHGDPAAATGWFERTRAACGPPGLLTEEFDVSQRQLRGNLPQAFVHALLIETAARLERVGL